MASLNNQGVRIGPISLFTLVTALGMAVLAVLTISTANAMNALSKRSATMAYEAYEAEYCGQAFVGALDETLAATRSAGGSRDDALVALSSSLDEKVAAATAHAYDQRDGSPAVTGEAKLRDNVVTATFDTSSGRRLSVRINIKSDLTYSIAEWKATSKAGSVAVEEHLWSGTSS